MPHAAEGILHAYLDGALPALEQAGELPDGQTAADVEAHLATCADCRALLESERAVREAAGLVLRDAAPLVELPSFESVAGSTRPRRRLLPLAWAASLLLAAGGGWWAAQLGDAGAARETAMGAGDDVTHVAAVDAGAPPAEGALSFAPAGPQESPAVGAGRAAPAGSDPRASDPATAAEKATATAGDAARPVEQMAAAGAPAGPDRQAAAAAAAAAPEPVAAAPAGRPLEQVAAAPPPPVTRQAPGALPPSARRVEDAARPQAAAAPMAFRAQVQEAAGAADAAPPADIVALLARSASASDWTPLRTQEVPGRMALPLLTVDGGPPAAVAYRADATERVVVRVTQDVPGAGAVELLVWRVPQAAPGATVTAGARAEADAAAPVPMGMVDDGDERQLVVRLPDRGLVVAVRARLTPAELQDLAGRLEAFR
jgi:hypothetical protein